MKYVYKSAVLFTAVLLSVGSTSCYKFNWPWAAGADGVKHEKMVIRKRVGQEVEVEVKRGQHGFTWHMVREPNPTMLEFDEKDMPRTKRARSEYEWEYDAKEPGTTWIVLEQRNLEGKVVARKTYKIVIAPRKGSSIMDKAHETRRKVTDKVQYGARKVTR